LIDRLTLGFWARLFRPVNNDVLWNKYPNILREIFENRHSRITLSQIYFELEQVRNCRNRISHNGSLLVHRRRQFSCRQIYKLMRRLICEMGGESIVDQLKTFDYFELILRQGYAMGLADNIDMGDWVPQDTTPAPAGSNAPTTK
ncbi:hypothetical protein HDR66_03045, partial [bacterium]|nr:hypothetical protein [bacterium]